MVRGCSGPGCSCAAPSSAPSRADGPRSTFGAPDGVTVNGVRPALGLPGEAVVRGAPSTPAVVPPAARTLGVPIAAGSRPLAGFSIASTSQVAGSSPSVVAALGGARLGQPVFVVGAGGGNEFAPAFAQLVPPPNEPGEGRLNYGWGAVGHSRCFEDCEGGGMAEHTLYLDYPCNSEYLDADLLRKWNRYRKDRNNETLLGQDIAYAQQDANLECVLECPRCNFTNADPMLHTCRDTGPGRSEVSVGANYNGTCVRQD
jgi:hypothetical protein